MTNEQLTVNMTVMVGLLAWYIKDSFKRSSDARDKRLDTIEGQVERQGGRLSTLIGFLSGRGIIRVADMDDSDLNRKL